MRKLLLLSSLLGSMAYGLDFRPSFTVGPSLELSGVNLDGSERPAALGIQVGTNLFNLSINDKPYKVVALGVALRPLGGGYTFGTGMGIGPNTALGQISACVLFVVDAVPNFKWRSNSGLAYGLNYHF